MTTPMPSSIPDDSEAAADWHVPAPHGLPWGPRRAEPPSVEVRPMLCAAMEASDSNTQPAPVPRVVVLRRAYRRAFWQGFITGAMWVVVLAFTLGWLVGVVRSLSADAEQLPTSHSPAQPASAWDARA